jgi:hypothetical protein
MRGSNHLLTVLVSMAVAIPAGVIVENRHGANGSEKHPQPGFQSWTLNGRRNWRTELAEVSNVAHSGKQLPWKSNDDNSISFGQVDLKQTPDVPIPEITLTGCSGSVC